MSKKFDSAHRTGTGPAVPGTGIGLAICQRVVEHQKALRAENAALAEYSRVLRIFTNLTVRGIIPDEDE